MATTTSRSARYATWLSIPLGLLISALLIWQASYAAFSDTTVNANNSWATGNVEITHNSTTPLFTIENLAPGDTGFKDVTGTYSGSLNADVALYAANVVPSEHTTADGKTLADFIQLTIQGSAGGVFDTTASGVLFAQPLASLGTSFDGGLGPYRATGGAGQQGTFRFTYRLADDTPNELQNASIKVDFVLEARSVPGAQRVG
ncbi:TasA family protein [Georgenia sp. H159]|uniref:TasA family protein n=1 Tax=Georgenia sp. H159 TaxID=3076115 RepID=UPI002D7716E3|nr:TasA family protein [Georgenia sp. H159]